jgi:tellurite methyltransferase
MKRAPPGAPFWETAYQIPTGSTFGKPSAEIVALADALAPDAAILDLGCGEGRNALFLAERGFDVTAADVSEFGIAKLRSLAARSGRAVQAHVADMRSYRFDRKFDLIISHGCLHLIAREEWLGVLDRMKAHTQPGGYNVIAVFTDMLPPPPDLEPFCVGLFHEGELFTYYSDWLVTLQDSYVFDDEHPGGLRHTHPVNKIVARRLA